MRCEGLTNRIFGKLVVVGLGATTSSNGVKRWLCRCECGGFKEVRRTHLMTGKTSSCGCIVNPGNFQHGMYGSPEHKAWQHMKERCFDTNHSRFVDYGGRGITMDATWHDFEVFLAYVGKRPSDGHSLDRINNEGNYEPGNVKWSTDTEQARNKRNTLYVTIDNEIRPLREWCELFDFPINTAYKRLKRGQSPENIFR